MPVHNSDVADIFSQIADLLDIQGANEYRIRAYRTAAQTIGSLSRNVSDMVEEGEDLTELPGIGEDLAGKIEEIVETGTLEQLQKLRAETPAELADALNIAGLGPKRVKKLHEELGIDTLDELKAAAEAGEIRQVHGFGKKIEQKILEDIKEAGEEEERTKLVKAEEVVGPLLDYLNEAEGVDEVVVAGSYRRRKETVGDLDVLVTCDANEQVMNHFMNYEDVDEVVSHGDTRSTVILRSGLQVDVRVVAEESYGAALHYFTGSKAHNIAVREMGVERGFKINEYGVFEDDDGKRVAGETEAEVYEVVDLPYIEPELRERRGEIEAAQQGALPDLITLDDIRGDLQSHSTATDGHYSIEEMAKAARERGHEYLAITDHSQRVAMTQGLDAERLAEQIEEIERLNRELNGIRVLKSVEVDILEDGSLDVSDGILKELDLRVCSIHSKFDLSRDQQTERIIQAMDNPYFNILAHPTGRLIGERDPYDVDMERIVEAAKERRCYLELNASPHRLDLSDIYCKMAKEMGVKIAISTDAHRTSELDWMRFGVWQGRRGWLEPEDVLNTRSWEGLKELLAR